jgi:hypothetical protein
MQREVKGIVRETKGRGGKSSYKGKHEGSFDVSTNLDVIL